MENQIKKPGAPSPGPWRQTAQLGAVTQKQLPIILDSDGKQAFFAFGPNAQANIELVLQNVNLSFLLSDALGIEPGADIHTSADTEFAQFLTCEMKAALRRWVELTPEKRAAYAAYNLFADKCNNSGLVTPDGPWAQSYRDQLRNLHNSEAPIPIAFLPQNQEP